MDNWYARNKNRVKANHLRWRTENKARWVAMCRAWRKANPEKVKAAGKRWAKKNAAKRTNYTRKYRLADPAKHAAYARDARRRLSEAVFAIYGGACACCGEREFRFLTLDHIENNGSKLRRETGQQLANLPIHPEVREAICRLPGSLRQL